MDPERWRRVEELYHSALEHDPEQRHSFLVAVCGDDEDILHEVETLLQVDAHGDFVIDKPAFSASGPDDSQLSDMGTLLSLSPGMEVGPYVIESQIGAGGMGEVYRARDTRLRRKVALKFLRQDVADDARRRRRFESEARAVAALNHPNIVSIFDFGQLNGYPYAVSELIEGQSLRALLRKGPVPVRKLIDFAVQIADGLAAAHAAGIAHRDLKPENIMISNEGRIKILDFGLAQRAPHRMEASPDSSGTGINLTEPGNVVGTPSYMSPEQARGAVADYRSDQFSFGLVLYELATGKQAFARASTVETLTAILREEPAPIQTKLPAPLSWTIDRCLAKEPRERYESTRDLYKDLRSLGDHLSDAYSTSELPGVRHDKVRLSRSSLFYAAVAALVAAAGFASWQLWPVKKQPSTPFRVVPVTSYPGRENTPSFSPDGNQIAFSWDGEKGDNSDIYIKVIGENSALRLTNDPRPEFSPAWSPDGRHIAFCRDEQDATEIVLIPALGGPERVIARLPKQGKPGPSGPPLSTFEETGDSGQLLAWFPDAQSLAFVARKFQAGPWAIFRLSVDSGEIQQLTFPPEQGGGDVFPTISRDGHYLAFIRLLLKSIPPWPELYVTALTAAKMPAGEPQRVTTQEHEAEGGLVWISDNRRILFASARGLWSVALNTGNPEPLPVPGYNPLFLAISAKGDRLAFVKSYEDLDIWRVDGPTHSPARAATVPVLPTKLITSTAVDTNPQYSPDGRHIAFTSSRNGTTQIWVCDRDGSNPVQITNFEGAASPRWSPDSRYIAFDSPSEGRFGIYVIPAEGGPVRRMTPQSSQNGAASWSGDRKWIYFSSDRTGVWQVWRLPFAGGAAVQVTHNGGAEPFESRDGKFVYYANMTQPGLWRVATEGGAETLVVPQAEHFHWGLFDDGVCWIERGAIAQPTIDCLDFRTNHSETVSRLPRNMHVNNGGPSFSVSPDGRTILFVASDRRESNIMMVENFRLTQ